MKFILYQEGSLKNAVLIKVIQPFGCRLGSPVRPFNWVNKQANNRHFSTEKSLYTTKSSKFGDAHAPR